MTVKGNINIPLKSKATFRVDFELVQVLGLTRSQWVATGAAIETHSNHQLGLI